MNENPDYPASWYAATRNNDTAYPALDGQFSADVCIIGAGFSGLSTAIYLAERGFSVVVLEAHRVGWGASGRNGGQLVRGYGEDTQRIVTKLQGEAAGERARQLGDICLDLVRAMIETYAIECDLTSGYLRLALTARQARRLRVLSKEWQRTDAPGESQLIEQSDLKDFIGSDVYWAGLYSDFDGSLHPLNLALGEARALTRLGGRIFERTPATGIHYGQPGGSVRVTTPSGDITANALVLCGNAYLEKLVPTLRPTLIPGYSGIIATESLSAEQISRIMPGRPVACSDLRTVVDYYRLTPDSRMLWGGLAHWTGGDSGDPARHLRRNMLKVFPWLRDVRIDYAWTGRLGISANQNPQIGRLAPNVYYAQAYSGHGVASAHLSGRMIADAITGDEQGTRDFEMFAGLSHRAVPPWGPVRKLARAWAMNSRRVIEWF